ncbi:aminotransferase class III-fold pyridoxal phosphate-dependent enzyme [Galactobacter sp.]|uniref:aminotransferase class III-fold pyridoxal phosphate-dependent enzyme n=1 Tax=Galactobacter sp. TaxID=2676125 RepID=UPI0025C14DCA|nr:aminotransferase class III-fold pyridoxal phosphate-dependent enzyme [Galactobacter sp.]
MSADQRREITVKQREVEAAAYEADLSTVAGVERLRFFPLATAGGHGAELVTASGREVLDLSAAWGAASFGYGTGQITDAVSAAAAAGAGASVLSGAMTGTTEFAARLRATVPTRASERVYLGLGGTDANSVAIRAARHATGRDSVVSFTGSYHGGHGLGQEAQDFGADSGAQGVARVFDYPVTAVALDELVPALGRHLAQRSTACVIVEAIQCDGGVRVPAPGFLKELRRLCDETGTLLIADEVKTGMGRTGLRFAYEHAEVLPDLVTLGKALGGGLPVGAVIGSAEALDGPTASALLTLAGNGIGAAAGAAVLTMLDDALLGHVRSLGSLARGLLTDYRASSRPGAEAVRDVRGEGLLVGVELASARLAALTCYRAWELGAVFYVVRDDVIELTPALTITSAELAEGLSILTQALDDAVAGLVPESVLEEFAGW